MPIKVPRVRAIKMQIIDEIKLSESTQKWLEPYKDFLDEIYWSGYAETLEKENPEAYSREYFYFLALYD